MLVLQPRRRCEALLPLMLSGKGVRGLATVAVVATKGLWVLNAKGGRLEDAFKKLYPRRFEQVGSVLDPPLGST